MGLLFERSKKEVAMERRDFIVGTLVRTGFRSSLKGFGQFCMCVEMYTDDRSATIESIYSRVARYCNCTKSSVEKNLRRLFESSNARSAIGGLFGMDCTESGNKEIVATFSNYVELQHDEYA